MNILNFLSSSRGEGRASRPQVGFPRRSRRYFWNDWFHRLEARQLLSGLVTESVTYTASVPLQTTDYNATLTLPKFDPSLGTLTQVALAIAASGNFSGTVSNGGSGAETLSITDDVDLALLDGTTTLLSPALNASQTFTDLASGASGQFGPFAPEQDAAANYMSGATFDDFGDGPGNIALTLATNTIQATSGGGGNIATNLVTNAGASATVTYTFTVATVSISGNVYQDLKGTGSLVAGDPPIPGTTLTLLDSTGAVVATTSTAPDGTYSFTSTAAGGPLFAGVYTIHETQPAVYLQGSNTVGTVGGVTDGTLTAVPDVIAAITLAPGQDSINNNFGEVLPVGISGIVYEDAKGTGMEAAGDPPIPDTTLSLFNTAGMVVATTTTNALGLYDFQASTTGSPLAPGDYTVVETQPAGYLQGSNTVGTVNGVTVGALTTLDTIGSIVLTSGQSSFSNNFGEVLPVSLSGIVYDDQDHSGSLNAGDTPISGVRINLYNSSGLVATTTTDVSGNYAFTTTASGAPLPPDTYTLVEIQPSQNVIVSIILTSGQDSVHNNFGEITPTTPPPPVVVPVHVTNVQRFGVHLQPTLIVISFDQPLNPSTAQDVALYQIFGPTDSNHPTLIPIQSATYNPATNMVTLRLAERLNVHHPYRLTIEGIEDASGGLLVGTNGVAGGSYVTTLNRSSLSGFTDIYGNFIPINHGKLYPAALASGYHLKRFVPPSNLGPFAAATKATFLAATAGDPETPPIAHRHAGKK